jgi:hypothetical protein
VPLEPDTDLCCNGSTPQINATTFRINRGRDFVRFFTGTMDELALYDRALSASEVGEHFAAFIQGSAALVGDINGDGSITSMDARLLLAVLVGQNPSEAINFTTAGDVNADGTITNLDAALLDAVVAAHISPPPDNRRISAVVMGSNAVVTGGPGAAVAGGTVHLTNRTNGASETVTAGPDGSFAATLAAGAGANTIVIDNNGSPARITLVVSAPLPPDGTIVSPQGNVAIPVGGTVDFQATCTDPDNNTPSPLPGISGGAPQMRRDKMWW